jgi:hypothetical protein
MGKKIEKTCWQDWTGQNSLYINDTAAKIVFKAQQKAESEIGGSFTLSLFFSDLCKKYEKELIKCDES